jgi:hypothetical protein
MHTIVETPIFTKRIKEIGLTGEEHEDLILFLAANPEAGTIMPGTGGARKLRWAGKGKGKSGGYRVITFYSGVDVPLFLLDIYTKGEKDDLSKAEQNQLKKVLGILADAYRSKINE